MASDEITGVRVKLSFWYDEQLLIAGSTNGKISSSVPDRITGVTGVGVKLYSKESGVNTFF